MFCKVLSLQRISKDMDSMEWTVIPKTLHKTDVHVQIPHQKKNKIKTTKYTLLNFIPKNLFEQFHRFANLYFLFIIILNFIPQINAFGKEISMIPLIFVLAVTAVKDLVEDRQRYLSDKTVNNRYSDVYDLEKDEFRQKKWQDMEVGDIIRLNNNDIIPCDMLLINTSDENGLCHISSANLDGENNLKQKKVPKGFLEDQSKFDAKNIGYQVKCKEPDDQIHSFCGYLVHPDGEGISLDQNNLLLRGCVLKNTEYIYGLVIYAGHDTKAMKNDNGPRYKRTQLEKDINTDVIGCVVILFTFCLIGAISMWPGDVPFFSNPLKSFFLPPFYIEGWFGCGFWTKRNELFEKIYSTDGAEESYSYEGFLRFWTFIIILQVIIPISLYVSVEIVKLGQVFYINRDKHMIYKETAQYPVCRATNINEDLGQINYIFSDKTGTLTENKMIFKRFAILGDTLMHPEDPSDDVTAGQCLRLHDSFCKNNGPKAAQIWDDFFTTLAICNTVVVAKQPSVSSETLKISILNSSTNSNSDVSSVNKPMNGHVIPEGIATDSNDDESDGSSRKYNRSLTVPVTRGGIIVDEKEYNKRRLNGSVSSDIQRRYTYSKPINDRLSKSVESISSWLDCGLVPQYEYESPDEGALVKAASSYGYTLANRTPEQIFFTRSTGDIRIFDILQVLQFDSARKRMSVIVRDDEGKIIVYCKGADTEIMSVLHEGQGEIKEETNVQLEEFAREGLRTLCVAMRVLSEDEYNAWLENHKAAELALENRAEKLAESAKVIETKLTLLGATGIEDKLQDGVPETIAGLKNAGINLWILTGDKQETAVNIGFSCKLLNADMDIITINSSTKSECSELLDQIIQRMNSKTKSYTVLPTTSNKKNNEPMALIIDGYSLAFTLEKPLDAKFIEIARHCESVICCRAAPIQKAAVVKLMRENLKVMTLAIGDGANDVSMLQEAEIGVGIAGQEGVQAVMASDFVLGRFRFLKRLLLLHGFWCYDRIARMILYFFYKNTMFIGLLFWYQIFNGFSGSNAIDDVSLILFNLIFTSVPPIICGIWDQCIPEHSVLLRPMLYRWGQQGKAYTRTLFWLHILDSIFQSLVLFFIPYLTFSDLPFGMYAVGVTFHQLAVITANLHIGIQTPNWTVIHAVVIIGSVVISYLFYFVYCAISPFVVVYWTIYEVMGMPEFWFLSILCPVVALLPRILWKVCETTFFPSVIQQVQRYIHNKATKDKEDNALKNLSESNSNHQNHQTSGCNIETSTPT